MHPSSSPMSYLPSELLSEIFRLCNLSVDQTDADMCGENACMTVNPYGLDFTVSLSMVCRRWRDIIYDQANLWSNICINQNLLSGSLLKTKQISVCLERSRKHPLNILIDARDPDWNWTEDGVGIHATDDVDDDDFNMDNDPEDKLMPVLFTSEHMYNAISLLLPHISRWKSFTVLTDTWAPIHEALCIINPVITTYGAPMLETLSLLRCNALPSYYHDFQPASLKSPAFLSGGNSRLDIIPRLKNLLLEGVHVDWEALSSRLESSPSKTLETLELRYHCAAVRPTLPQYRRLLNATPALQKLTIKCSGAYTPDDFVLPSNYVPVSLLSLKELTVGYQTAEDGEMALELFTAPNVKHLTLEDSSHYASAEQYADDMLSYLASKASYSDSIDLASAMNSPAVHACERRPDSEVVTSPKRTYFSEDPLPPFPLLEKVTLNRIDGSAEALHTFFRALNHVQHVDISNMSMDALRALLPSVGPRGPSCACPQLRSVVVHDLRNSTHQEYKYYSCALMTERPKYHCGLQTVQLRYSEGNDERLEMDDSEELEVDSDANMESDDDDDEVRSEMADSVGAGALKLEYQCHSLKDQEMNTLTLDHDGIFNDSGFSAYHAAHLVYH